ncbi:MAG: hypothetical protein M1321_02725 [Candidatus Marsarchaeota archaeon]|nr:hypothetical protein [Candidatus Marsarchaeota archaeon]
MEKIGVAIGSIVIVIIVVAGAAYYISRTSASTATMSTATSTITAAVATTTAVTTPHAVAAVPVMRRTGSRSVEVNASRPANATVIAPDGVNITVSIPAGTYALVGNSLLGGYNFTIATFSIENVSSPPGKQSQTPAYGFAFEVNGEISPGISFVNSTKAPVHLTTVTHYPSTWYSWAYVGGAFNSSTGTYTGGNYLVENEWSYAANGTMTNTQFYKPIMWIFTIGPAQQNAAVTTTANASPTTTAVPDTTTSWGYG